MKEGVYYMDFDGLLKSADLKYISFVKVTRNGMVYGKKNYVFKIIKVTLCYTEDVLACSKSLPPTSIRELFDKMPIHIAKDSVEYSVNAVEDSTIYKFYAEHLTECNIPFRMIEHMLENYKTLKQSLKEILSELNID